MKLDEYKSWLDQKTFEGMGKDDEPRSRYHSFKICLEYLQTVSDPQVLELGTCRSFVDGAFVGCNEDNPKYWEPNNPAKWDWGAGCFSLVFGQNNCKLTTVDIISNHINRCRIMTNSLGIKCDHIVSDSIKFLQRTGQHFHLIYLDTGDMWPIEPTAQLQLEEAKIICERNLLQPQGMLLIDDVRNKTPRELGDVNNELGKSKYSIPFLLKNGFKSIFEGYQYILQKQ
jgi:hypothetical protein